VQVSDGNGPAITSSPTTLTINPAISLVPTTLSADTVGVAYNRTILATGGTAPLTFTVSNIVNQIPGLILPNSVQNSFNITGTPTGAGTMTFRVTAIDNVGASSFADYSITVRNPVPKVTNLTVNSTLAQGAQATLTGTIVGPSDQPFTLVVNWGDGSSAET